MSKKGIFTIVTAPYFGGALALARAARRRAPEVEINCLVVGSLKPSEEKAFPGRVFNFSKMAKLDPELWNIAFRYSGFEVCCALKPYFAAHLFAEGDFAKLVYLDTDILLTSDLEPVFKGLDQYEILLSPHLLSCSTSPREDWDGNEEKVRIAGTFNMGFFAVRRSEGADRFLHWWRERTFFACAKAPQRGIFDDQRWVDLAPALFPSLGIFRHPGCNVAHWNLHERTLSEEDGKILANGEPLLFFHFSGWNPNDPLQLSRHSAKWRISENTVLANLVLDYAGAMLDSGWQDFKSRKYEFDYFDQGLYIPPNIRAIFSASSIGNPLAFGNPFSTQSEHSFLRWLFDPGPDGIAPLVNEMRARRPDVIKEHPELRSMPQKEALFQWAIQCGAKEFGLPPEYIRLLETYGRRAKMTVRLERGDRTVLSNPGTFRPIMGFGVNLVGMLRSEKGGGVGVRGSRTCLDLAGIHTGFVNLPDEESLNNEGETGIGAQENPFSINLIHIPPFETPKLHRFGRSFFAGRTNIAYWAWELDEFPDSLHEYFRLFDEIWVPSHFVQKSLARFSPVPVVCVPHPVESENSPRHRWSQGPMTFGFSFDFDSFYLRKNPDGLVRAFKNAFEGVPNVRLLIKTMRAEKYPKYKSALETLINGDARIFWTDQVASALEMKEWWQKIDVFVSLHRSEGFGLSLAEAMSRGLPTVATAYSGNLDFMNPENSLLVKAGRSILSENYGPYPVGATWAEPDLEDASTKLRWIFENRPAARKLGQRAHADIMRELSPRSIAKIYRQRLPQLRRGAESWL